MDRRPAVAGQFYPGNEASLKAELKKYLVADGAPRRAMAVVSPHAGYVYSGAVAGHTFASVEVPRRCIVLSPNHTGMGARAAVMTSGNWIIPTGNIPVDDKLADEILKGSGDLRADNLAHMSEHSLEVQLPFMLARQPELSIVPITLSHLSAPTCRKIGAAIAGAVKDAGDHILIVASTDMNHYEDQARTLEKDRMAIERVQALDGEGLLSTCAEHGISMCGVVPTAVTIFACRELGATKATLIEHKTSGDVSGDYNAVVGYAGFVIV